MSNETSEQVASEETPPSHAQQLWWLAGLAVGLLLVGIVVIVLFPFRSGIHVTSQNNESVAAGNVISQNPSGGTRLAYGSLTPPLAGILYERDPMILYPLGIGLIAVSILVSYLFMVRKAVHA